MWQCYSGAILFLDSADARRDIQMYINSPGGSVIDGLGIYDTCNMSI
jgi:ATP-dependent Clp protease protease subunit